MCLRKIFINVSFFLLSIDYLYPNMAPEGFERFPNEYFVETGTYYGDGVNFAVRAKFPFIYSIEIDPLFVLDARNKFEKHKNVSIWYGDSGEILWDLIKTINKPITFWLDGHSCVQREDGKNNTPLLAELEQIKKHPLKNHTILIDDMHCCGTFLFDFMTKETIIQKILEINPNYVITYVDGGDHAECKDNIMVAIPQKTSRVAFLVDSELVRDLGYDDYDPNTNGENLAIKSLIKDGDIVFDVGANVGNWTAQVLSEFKDTHIFSFEPIPCLVESMKERFKGKNVNVCKMAAFSEAGYINFDYYEKSSDASGIYHQNWITPCTGEEPKKIIVEAMPIDQFCYSHKIDHINFLKIDTEGCELDVLKGASDLLRNHAVDFIQFEYTFTYPDANITLKQVYGLLTNLGYDVFRAYSEGLIHIPEWNDSLEVYRYSNYIAIADSMYLKLKEQASFHNE